LRLALPLTIKGARNRIWKKRNLLAGRKSRHGLRGRTKAIDARDIRVSQKNDGQAKNEPSRHNKFRPAVCSRQSYPAAQLSPRFYDAGNEKNSHGHRREVGPDSA
jgi:hypothetical protein